MANTEIKSDQLSEIIAAGMREKKGEKITRLDMRNIDGSICDYFVICQADNSRQVAAIADAVEDYVWEHTHQWPYHKEGKDNAEWILLDYVDAVAHIFIDEKREFYKLEKLWADAERTDYADEL